jgi:hypothetical protein
MGEYGTAVDLDQLLVDAVQQKWISQTVADHVTDHWLDLYWPTAEAQEVLQRGLYWAMRVAAFRNGDLARRRMTMTTPVVPAPLPIYCAWVCSGAKPKKADPKKPKDKDVARFEAITLESERQVTLLLVTPEPNGIGPSKSQGQFQPIWATRRGIPFPPVAGESQIESWNGTITVRPHDLEEYPLKP